MKKIHRAVQKEPNKWEKRTGWKWETEDFICLGILLMVVGFVVIRCIIG